MLFLDEAAVREVLRWDELIPAMEAALVEFSRGAVLQPLRTVLAIEERQRYLGLMPAVAADVMGLKFVSFYPVNAGSESPTHQATIVLYRTGNGQPLAVMDGRLITEMRTAAVSAAVTKYLASPRSSVLAILGSGVQAGAHLEALKHVGEFDEVRVWSRTPEHATAFARERDAIAMPTAEAAVRDADVIVTATAAREPILRGAWLKEGAHVNAVGSSRPDCRELDGDAMRNTVVVDSREAALAEAGDVIIPGAEIQAEIGEIFSGARAPLGNRTTIFKSVGLAVEDVAAARLVVDAYERRQHRS
ncbi:MAG TPA: NAD(P)-binding domain-containing protein [Candidatus Cybelea sp.]|jgi:thiomorpholine-carboxylate dehydrogenase|nr:NAD(P)-binding domain-containing protein [Candidatus Cybelea sp.]